MTFGSVPQPSRPTTAAYWTPMQRARATDGALAGAKASGTPGRRSPLHACGAVDADWPSQDTAATRAAIVAAAVRSRIECSGRRASRSPRRRAE